LKYELEALGGLQGNSTGPNPVSFLPHSKRRKLQEMNGETIAALSTFDKRSRDREGINLRGRMPSEYERSARS
jgi:hypothetical protein